ncbi:MAG: hypothetical protein WBD31_23540 [Rubripirellula sp.]
MESNNHPAVLELRNVSFTGNAKRSLALADVSLMIRQGELLMLHLDRSQNARDIASLIQGLRQPRFGEVLFQESDWKGNDFDRHFKMRSKIGRVFDDQAWLANLNMAENLMLASEHHGRDLDEVRVEVAELCEQLSLDPTSWERPAFVDSTRLQLYQWVRAMIGSPSLVLLERPMKSVPTVWLPKLVAAVNRLRQRGAAVLWFAGNSSEASAELIPPVAHFRLVSESLQPIADLSLAGPEATL